jgi:multidrug efflux pump subunit AcrA (membrane-fusion protein)
MKATSMTPRFAFVMMAIISTAAGCHREAAPSVEKLPPAPVKWEAARQIVLEEWTELVGTAQPLPERAARVTAPVEGRVISVLRNAQGQAIAEGQRVERGDVLARLDATVLQAARDKASSAKKVLQAEKEATTLGVKQAALEVKRLNDLKRDAGSSSRRRTQVGGRGR